MPNLIRVSYVLLVLACYPTATRAQSPPDECGRTPILPLDVLRPWRGILQFKGEEQARPQVLCFGLELTSGQFVRAVSELGARPPVSGFSIDVYFPGQAEPAFQRGLGFVRRATITWQAEASGLHYLVLRDARTTSGSMPGMPVGIWVEQIEPPSLAEARESALLSDPRVTWLRENVAPVRSIDPEDTDFSDLEPLRSALDGVRLVLLGEVEHGAGTDFLAKSRLVKFLHQELGFDVLAFEAGLYGMTVAWDSLGSGAPPREAMALGAWGFWTNTEQMQPLIRYLGEQARGERPLELTGFDNVFTPSGASVQFAEDLGDFLTNRGLSSPFAMSDSPDRHVLEAIATMRYRRGEEAIPDSTARAAFLDALDETISLVAKVNDDTGRYWTRVLRGTACHAREVFANRMPDLSLEPFCLRDRQMAEHLLWLLDERYPGRKIIAWAATAHVARLAEIPPAGGFGPSMGQFIAEALDSTSYAIGVTSYRGTDSYIVVDQHPLPEFEELMALAGFDYGLLDLRRAATEGNWAGGEFWARAIDGLETRRAVWSELLDALLFVRDFRLRSYGR